MVSPNWLAEHLGVNPRYAAGFQGIGQLPGSVAMAVNAVASGAADYVLLHRALHNPVGALSREPDARGAGAQQWTAPQGFFGPLAMIALPYNEYLQRYGAAGRRWRPSSVEARKNGARIPWSYWHDQPLEPDEYLAAPMIYDPDLPLRLRHPRRRRRRIRVHLRRAGQGPARIRRSTSPATPAGAPTRRRLPLHWPLDDIMDGGHGDGSAAVGARRGRGRRTSICPQVYDGFSPFV